MGTECPKCHFDNPDDTVYCGKCATPLPYILKTLFILHLDLNCYR